MSLKEKVQGIIDDLTSLEVATFSGPLDLSLSDHVTEPTDNTESAIKSKDIFNSIKKSLKDNGKLVGYTRFELDGDTVNFMSDQITQETVFLLEGHKSMVAAAQESRAGLVRFVGNVAGFDTLSEDSTS